MTAPAGLDRLFPDVESIERFVDILTSRGVDWGLIGPREVPRIWDRHILNSVAIRDLVPEGSAVVDVGSGAGLPGIPLALARPDLQVTLLEPLLRRVTFLTEAVEELGLAERVRVVRARAEDHRERYDLVVARALAPLPRLVPWCSPLMADDGEVLALKGKSAAQEVQDAAPVLASAGLRADVREVRADATSEPTSVVRIRRALR
ncbi:16S rRNA (guanine527-N7)-methyltransferase [Friedmanniella endophytica]|uniref:Ribosomal RNA small subunit methyltransferase G n=1 Tax=Microlunatus kandeliicorticis TaxID=1759536 RepID=A0A7W3IR08_9ACTN|nr:16S rRNA (guanine(527)-N(7))-methyltransferase RsmG [Microlunatus kandeliicorticis]MBA8793625.1 16S rRNA (guanine527-N7)-methyltransferase [Microlunatus kandeliicorticis]